MEMNAEIHIIIYLDAAANPLFATFGSILILYLTSAWKIV